MHIKELGSETQTISELITKVGIKKNHSFGKGSNTHFTGHSLNKFPPIILSVDDILLSMRKN